MTAKQVMTQTSALRDAAINGMQKCAEELTLYAFSIKDSQSSEYFEAIKTQAEILSMIVDARGFNKSLSSYGKWMGTSEKGMRKYRRGIERAGGSDVIAEKMLSSSQDLGLG